MISRLRLRQGEERAETYERTDSEGRGERQGIGAESTTLTDALDKASQLLESALPRGGSLRAPGPAHFCKNERPPVDTCSPTHLASLLADACVSSTLASLGSLGPRRLLPQLFSARIRNKESPLSSKMLGPLGRGLFLFFFFFWEPRRQHILDPHPRICEAIIAT